MMMEFKMTLGGASKLMTASNGEKQMTLVRLISSQVKRQLGRCAAGITTGTLALSITAMAAAQQANIYMKDPDAKFKTAPSKPPAEEGAAAAADAATLIGDSILGIPVNTIFFVAAGVIAVFWFTIGGGRKPKVAPRS